VINRCSKSQAIESSEGGRDTDQGRGSRLIVILPEIHVLQHSTIATRYNVMGFIDKDQLETIRDKLAESAAGYNALNRCYRYIGLTGSVRLAHLDLDSLVGICYHAMADSLLKQFPPMHQDKRLTAIGRWISRNPVN
jgi:hypothetical protein